MTELERIERLEKLLGRLLDLMAYNLDAMDRHWIERELKTMRKELEQ